MEVPEANEEAGESQSPTLVPRKSFLKLWMLLSSIAPNTVRRLRELAIPTTGGDAMVLHCAVVQEFKGRRT